MHLRGETELGPYEIEQFFNLLHNLTESTGNKNTTSFSGMEKKVI